MATRQKNRQRAALRKARKPGRPAQGEADTDVLTPEKTPYPGGQGARSEIRLVKQAITCNWPILRKEPVVRWLESLATGENQTDRTRIAAALALLAADEKNVALERRRIMSERMVRPRHHVQNHRRVVITPQLTGAERAERLAELIAIAQASERKPAV